MQTFPPACPSGDPARAFQGVAPGSDPTARAADPAGAPPRIAAETGRPVPARVIEVAGNGA